MIDKTAQPLRIAHIIGSLAGGGAETQCLLLMNGLRERKISNVAITFSHRKPSDTVPEESIVSIDRGGKWQIGKLRFALHKALESYKPNVLHLWLPELLTIPAAAYARRRRIAILSAQRGGFSFHCGPVKSGRQLLGCVAHCLADRIVSNFPVGNQPRFFQHLFKWKNGMVIPNGIDVCPVNPDVDVPYGDFSPKGFNILYVGRFVREKRVDVLLQAFDQFVVKVPNARLYLIGSGASAIESRLRAYVDTRKELRDKVVFLGWQTDWRTYANRFSLFVLPSASEGMPNSLFEAMQAGLPCLSARLPGIECLVQHAEHAWLMERVNQNDLIFALYHLYKERSLRERMGVQGAKLVRELSVDNMVARYLHLYDTMASSL